ncbi:MAG: hypothetical protein IK069_04320, partial [Firmicutes bacterium]|nr:hypothetical protein [Bacillota bacterium]
MYKAKEHPFKTVSKMIKDGSYPSVILLYGKERFLVDWALKAISDSVLNPVTREMDMAVFSEKEDSVSEIIAACETVPFMSEKKVVIIKDIGIDSSEDFTEYLSNVPETTLILISQEKADKRKAFFKKVEKCGLAYDFGELDEASLVSWVNKRFASKGKSIARNDIIRFASDAG